MEKGLLEKAGPNLSRARSWVRYNMGTGSIEYFPMGVMMLDESYSVFEMNEQLRWS